jgi:ATP-binding cassette subfamily B protein
VVARFYQPQQGRVLVDSHDIRSVTGESLHKQMGLVLQVNYLFTGTVMENIRYATPTASEQDVINAAQAIGSYDAIMSLKDGFNSEVGERGANMSLGQRQLICFTRAFLADPHIRSTKRPARGYRDGDGRAAITQGYWPGGRPSSSPTA